MIYFFCVSFNATNFKNSRAAFFLSSSIYLLIDKLVDFTYDPLTPSFLPGKAVALNNERCGI